MSGNPLDKPIFKKLGEAADRLMILNPVGERYEKIVEELTK